VVSIAHSYCVASNRRLADEMARQAGGAWEITAVSPRFVWGDLRPVPMEPLPGERCRSVAVPAYFTSRMPILLYGRELREILKSSWDIVHCWEEPYVFAGAQVALWTPRSSKLVYATCQNISRSYPPPFGWLERFAMRRADGWVAFGESIRAAMLDRVPYRTRPHRVIPFGVDLDLFRPDEKRRERTRRRLGWEADGPPVVGFLGRFVREKGLRTLMRCLDEVPQPWRAMFVGEGVMETELRKWAGQHGERVRVVTGVSHGEVPDYLNAMDLLCVPSRTTPGWREQFGRVLIEAFACGVPVVGSDSGEIPHVIGDAGVIVGETDPGGWVKEITTLLHDPARRAELSARGLERVHAKYSWPIVAQEYLDFFEDLLER
jgi:glycosyltransferase involved in cell wall biosynthesis